MIRVLIVDDQVTNRYLLRKLLEGHGLEVDEAHDGAEALARARQSPPQLVISDLLMPVMDGYTLLRRWREDQALCNVPFVVYTATYTDPNDEQLARKLGADAFLLKPAEPERILGCVHKVLEEAGHGKTVHAPLNETDEPFVLRQYSEVLIHKLEHKTTELQQALDDLQQAHDEITELNADLEKRVEYRTAQLAARNLELETTLKEVKQLRGILPICAFCKKIRDDHDYWQSVESYISQHTGAHFSHGFCPECYETNVLPQLREMETGEDESP